MPESSESNSAPLPGGAREDHARHAGAREPADLVRSERLARDLDERLRTSAGSVAEPLGLAAGEDDRLHRGYVLAAGRGACGTVSGGAVGRPMPSYVKPARRVSSGSSRLRPSMISGVAIAA